MEIVTLNRLSADIFGTYGVIIFNRKILCHTYELPWMANSRKISCIPEGSYNVEKTVTDRFGSVFLLHDVPGRSGILIHAGNQKADTEGCILPGLDTFHEGVLHSRLAMNKLLATLPYNFTLDIRRIK